MIIGVAAFKITSSIGGAIEEKAVAWAKKYVKYCQTKWPKKDYRLASIYGEMGRIQIMSSHDSIAESEDFNNNVHWNDTGVKALMEELQKTERQMGTTPFFSGDGPATFYYIFDVG